MRLAVLASGRTLLVGFGREGRSLERALSARHPAATVGVLCDSEPEPRPRHWRLYNDAGDAMAGGPDRVLRSPGVPLDHPVVTEAVKRGIPVACTSSVWFAERPDARVVGVTGSKGKSTTAALIAHLLEATGLRAELGGNIGRPMLDLLAADPDWFVVELSSYQLADLSGRVTVGAITRLFPEHQDWHGGVEPYYAAKLRLLDCLEGRPLWFNGADPVLAERLRGVVGARPVNVPEARYAADADGIRRGGERVVQARGFPLPGRHNLDNAALALAVVESIGGRRAAASALASFRPLAHRLERLDAPGPIAWINDSISTPPYATLAALEACGPRPVLIVGGLERGTDWTGVAAWCRRHPLRALIALPDNGPAIADALVEQGAVTRDRVARVEDLDSAVAAAAARCPSAGTVLLSPGAPSFPRFRDFEERGRRFAEAVRRLAAVDSGRGNPGSCT